MADQFGAATRLASLRPATTAVQTLYTATMKTETTRLFVTNVAGVLANFRLYHVPAGGPVDELYALIYEPDIDAGEYFDIETFTPGTGIQLEPGDSLRVRSSVANALAFNLYGVTINITGGQ